MRAQWSLSTDVITVNKNEKTMFMFMSLQRKMDDDDDAAADDDDDDDDDNDDMMK